MTPIYCTPRSRKSTRFIRGFVSCSLVLPEGPFELLLGGAGGSDVDGEEELFEVDVAVLVGVEGPAGAQFN